MNFTKWIITCVGVAVVAAAVWFFLSPRPAKNQEAVKDSYYCPMHPSYTSDRQGECPICHMALVKRKAREATGGVAQHAHDAMPVGYTAVTLDTQQRQLMGVRTVAVKKEPVNKTVRAVGYVAHNVDLYKIQNEFIDAYRKYVTVYRDYKRIEGRRRNWDVYREVQSRLLEAEHELTLLGLGETDIAKLRDIKWWQSWNQPQLAILRESDNYWIAAQIFERDLGFVEVGQKAVVNIPAFHEELTGIIRSVGGYVDTETRTTRALIEIEGHRGELKANMLAYVDIISELGEHLVVPSSAVLDLGERRVVFMEHGEGVYVPVDVHVAFAGDGYWAVHHGLKPGDRVVVSGNFLLDSESRMKAQISAGDGAGTAEVDHGQL